jgi:hypothetical protein
MPNTPSLAVRLVVPVLPEPHTELAREVVVDDNDARFDEHLTDRDIERATRRRMSASLSAVSCSSSVFVRSSIATLPRRKAANSLRLDQGGEVRRLGIVDLQVLGAQRRKLLQILAGGEVAFSRAAISAAGATMMTFSLLRLSRPLVRSTMSSAWSQGTFCRRSVTLPRDGIADDDVLAARVGEQLQHGACLDVLEVQRQALAGVLALFLGGSRGLARGLDLDDVLVVALVGKLLEVAVGADHDAGAVVGAHDVEGRGDRRGEVERIEATDQAVARHGSAGEIRRRSGCPAGAG